MKNHKSKQSNIRIHIIEPQHEISNNVVCATSKGSDQPAHTRRSLVRAFASRLICEYYMTLRRLSEHHLKSLSLKGGHTCWTESTPVIKTHCWKSYVTAHILNGNYPFGVFLAIRKSQSTIIFTMIPEDGDDKALNIQMSQDNLSRLCNSYTMACPPVRGDNPRALANGLSYVQVDKHGITILYLLH